MKVEAKKTLPWTLGVIIVLVATAMPAVMKHRANARRDLCINNLRLIHHAKTVLAIKNGWTNGQIIAESPEAVWEALNPYSDRVKILSCPCLPSGTHYNYNPVGVVPTCKYGKDHVFTPPKDLKEGNAQPTSAE